MEIHIHLFGKRSLKASSLSSVENKSSVSDTYSHSVKRADIGAVRETQEVKYPQYIFKTFCALAHNSNVLLYC